MDARTGKKIAKASGLELYYDTQWQSWGLIPADGMTTSEGSIWMSPGELHGLTIDKFRTLFVAEMVRRVEDR